MLTLTNKVKEIKKTIINLALISSKIIVAFQFCMKCKDFGTSNHYKKSRHLTYSQVPE